MEIGAKKVLNMIVPEPCNYVVTWFRLRGIMLNFSSLFLHGFWVFFAIFPSVSRFSLVFCCLWGFQKKSNYYLGVWKMGGKRKRVEPISCSEWKKKVEVWDILRHGNFTKYMERLNGGNPVITQQFIKTWKAQSWWVTKEWR